MTYQTFGTGLAAALVLGASVVQADTITLDFDQKEFDVLGDDWCFEEEGFGYCDYNQGLYGFAAPFFTLSDYDWDPYMRVETLDGRLFDPQQVDLTAINDQRRIECLDCAENFEYSEATPGEDRFPWDVTEYLYFPDDGHDDSYVVEQHDFDFIRVEGFRDGASVALDQFGAQADFDGVYEFSDQFRGIDALVIRLTDSLLYSTVRVADQTILSCPSLDRGCFSGQIDNLVVTYSDVPAAVPLPASGAMGLLALAGLGLLRRRV